jgi:asparagine synthase (glutamine-hydrolysing)
MGGIAGMMSVNGAPPPVPILQGMEEALAHRGRDGNGHYRSADVALVEARLAIVDLAGGDQPLYEPAGAALVADAEIVNHPELRAGMSDVVFATGSDCELPLHLYRRFGLDFTAHLRGMYAIALHDPGAGRLVLARDPFGIKPLYYVETMVGFAFASEPQALIRGGLMPPDLMRHARNELLQLQFTTGRETIFAGIQRVLPGETIVVAKGRIVERRRREALPSGGVSEHDEASALAEFDRRFADSVAVNRRADVPCGVFLSGGVDSSCVLGMMTRGDGPPVKAFTVGFGRAGAADERDGARQVAKALGVELIEVEFREADFWRLLPEIAGVMDDPAADYAILPTYKLAACAQENGVKVILSGEGGDELFGGYGRYRSMMRPWWAGGKLLRGRGNLEKLGLLRGDLAGWRDGIASAELNAAQGPRTRLQIAQATDCADWLPNDLLTKLDRCLMAFGLEGRAPFLDAAVADLGFRLADDLKIRRGAGKYLLRRWLAEHVPAAQPFAGRRGFSVPVGDWIARRGAQLGPLVAAQPGVREICIDENVVALFRDARGRHKAFAAWTLLFYALWHRHHIQAIPSDADVFTALAERA